MVFLVGAGFFVPFDATTFFVGAVVTTTGCLVGVATKVMFFGGEGFFGDVGFLVRVDALAAPLVGVDACTASFLVGVDAFTVSFLVGVAAFTVSFLVGVDAFMVSFLVSVEAFTVSFLAGVEATTVSFLVGFATAGSSIGEARGFFVASSSERLCIERPKT